MKTAHMRAPNKKPRHMKRPNFSKGGLIRKIAGRHYFDDGGSTTLTGSAPSVDGQSAATVSNNGLVGTVGNILGLNNQFQGQAANINQGTNTAQLNNAYTSAQSGLTQQQNLANEVANGGAEGVNTQNALTGQLEGVVNGTGPNAAQAALNQNTATNVANTAALAAGQRGANSNPGLIAREAAQAGAGAQQASAGQAATLQAQQQIAAQGQLANLASTQVGQQAGAVQGVNSATQNEQNILQGANTAGNNAAVSMQGNLNNVNSQTAAANQNQSQNIVGSVMNSGSSALSSIGSLLAKGGEVGDHHCAGAKCTDRAHYAHMMADGGPLTVSPVTAQGGIGPWLNSSTGGGSPSVGSTGSLPTPGAPMVSASKSAPAPKPAKTPSAPIAGNSAAEMNALPNQATPGNSADSMNALPDNAQTANMNAAANSGSSGGPISGGTAMAPQSDYRGGKIRHYDDGGDVGPWLSSDVDSSGPSVPSTSSLPTPQPPMVSAGSSGGGGGGAGKGVAALAALSRGGDVMQGPHGHVAAYLSGGGAVPAMVSPGERYLSPDDVQKVIREGANPLTSGKKVPGKPKVKGDSLKNDTVPATLQEGGVVLPRHIMNKKNRDHAELFVRRAVHMRAPKGGSK